MLKENTFDTINDLEELSRLKAQIDYRMKELRSSDVWYGQVGLSCEPNYVSPHGRWSIKIPSAISKGYGKKKDIYRKCLISESRDECINKFNKIVDDMIHLREILNNTKEK